LFDLQFVHNLFWLKLKWNARSKLFYWYHLSFLHALMKFKDIDKISKVSIFPKSLNQVLYDKFKFSTKLISDKFYVSFRSDSCSYISNIFYKLVAFKIRTVEHWGESRNIRYRFQWWKFPLWLKMLLKLHDILHITN
jgi:hypothetical protein